MKKGRKTRKTFSTILVRFILSPNLCAVRAQYFSAYNSVAVSTITNNSFTCFLHAAGPFPAFSTIGFSALSRFYTDWLFR